MDNPHETNVYGSEHSDIDTEPWEDADIFPWTDIQSIDTRYGINCDRDKITNNRLFAMQS